MRNKYGKLQMYRSTQTQAFSSTLCCLGGLGISFLRIHPWVIQPQKHEITGSNIQENRFQAKLEINKSRIQNKPTNTNPKETHTKQNPKLTKLCLSLFDIFPTSSRCPKPNEAHLLQNDFHLRRPGLVGTCEDLRRGSIWKMSRTS